MSNIYGAQCTSDWGMVCSQILLGGLICSPGGGGGVLSYMGYIGMCGAKGYVFFSRFGLK